LSFLVLARRTAGASFLLVGAIVIIGSAFVAATDRAGAAAIVQAVASSITCSSTGTSPCFNVTNSSSGVAVYGTSKSGTGLRGASTSNYGLKATSSSSDGVFGQSTSGTAGVVGTMSNGTGVYGYTSSGYGVYGSAPSGAGVYGLTDGGYALYGVASSGYGVVGISSGTAGVSGTSLSGSGVSGITSSGHGLLGQSLASGTAVYASSSSGYGVFAKTGGTANTAVAAVYGSNTNGNAGDFEGSYIGIVGRAPAAGYPLVGTDPNGNDVFYVDGNGNVSYKGGLYTFARTQGGGSARAYSTKTTAPTIEDTGPAQLVGGASSVRLDPTFAGTIDTTAPYRVFVTPHGDSRGLYIASESAAGFIVRESQGGRSSMTFDYRVVAAPVGHGRERMAMVGRDSIDAPRAPIPTVPNPPAIKPPTRPIR